MSAKRIRIPIDHTLEPEEPILLAKKEMDFANKPHPPLAKSHPTAILRCKFCRATYRPLFKRWLIPAREYYPEGMKVLEATCPHCEMKQGEQTTATA